MQRKKQGVMAHQTTRAPDNNKAPSTSTRLWTVMDRYGPRGVGKLGMGGQLGYRTRESPALTPQLRLFLTRRKG